MSLWWMWAAVILVFTGLPALTMGLARLFGARDTWMLLLAAIPLLWSIIGGSAAFLLNVPQDLGLLAAVALWLAVSFRRRAGTMAP